jgi:hypothetical protein
MNSARSPFGYRIAAFVLVPAGVWLFPLRLPGQTAGETTRAVTPAAATETAQLPPEVQAQLDKLQAGLKSENG